MLFFFINYSSVILLVTSTFKSPILDITMPINKINKPQIEPKLKDSWYKNTDSNAANKTAPPYHVAYAIPNLIVIKDFEIKILQTI